MDKTKIDWWIFGHVTKNMILDYKFWLPQKREFPSNIRPMKSPLSYITNQPSSVSNEMLFLTTTWNHT